MKAHTNDYKTAIKTFGRELDSKITYTIGGVTTELGNEELNSVSPHYEGSILKSVMKQLDIDSNVNIEVGTVLNYQFGVKVGNSYEYLNFGNYVVYKVEKQEDTNSYKITCYDKMLYSMIDYEGTNITYPITIRDYISTICTKLGLTFKNTSDTFANYDKEIASELFLDADGRSLGYTFRDILDQLAEVTASTICIDNQDRLEIRYINDTNDVIDDEYLKDVNVKFGEKYGPVNVIVLSRGGGSDNIYYPSTLPANPIEIKIIDNQIMNGNDRDTYLPDIYNKLNGLGYYINDFSSTGITYLELCDLYGIRIGETIYPCIMFNDQINITQGLEEMIYTDMPDEAVTDYSKSDTTDRKINSASIIANKAMAQIEEVTSQLNETAGNLDQVITKQTATDRTISILSTNIDSDGNVNSVTTKEKKFTLNDSGLIITNSETGFKSIDDETGKYFYDDDVLLGKYTKDGSMQKDLELFGVYSYGKEEINENAMFIAQLYTNNNGEKGFGHFYNGGDL